MRRVVKISLLCLIIAVALLVRSEFIREDGKYLLGEDSYYHYRMAETILSEGKRPQWDYLGSWPTGQPVSYPPLVQYFLAYSFKLMGEPLGFDLLHWCMYASIIPLLFCVLLMYLIGTLLTNEWGGLFAASVFATIPAVTMRTVIGSTDTDTFILLFSLLALTFFILAVKSEHGIKSLYAFVCGFSLFLFSLTWPGYWYMLPLLVVGFLGWIVQKRELTALELLIAFLVGFTAPLTLYTSLYGESILLLGTFIVYELMLHKMNRFNLHLVPGSFLLILSFYVAYVHLFQPAFHLISFTLNPQRDVLASSVTAMVMDNFAMTPKLAWEILGPSMFLAPLGLYFLVREKNVWLSTVLLFYLLGTSFMLLRGGRFSLLMAIPLCIGVVIFIMELPTVLRRKDAKMVATCGALLFLCVQVGLSEQMNEGGQFMTDDLWNALQWIDDNTPSDSVVIGHWGMGYFIESIGRRHSVMNGSQYDLFGRMLKYSTILTTSSEEVAVKEIFGFETESEVRELRVFSKDANMAQKQIKKEMRPFATDDVYLIVDEFTALSLNWWSQYGTWNYATNTGRESQYNVAYLTAGQRLEKVIEYKYKGGYNYILLYKAEDGFHSFVIQGSQVKPTYGTVFFSGGKKYYYTREDGVYGIVYLPYHEEEYEGEDPIFQHMSSYVLGIPEQFTGMMVCNLYFLEGDGLQYFELVKQVGNVKIYKVHKTPQENLNKGLIKKVDEFTLVVAPV